MLLQIKINTNERNSQNKHSIRVGANLVNTSGVTSAVTINHYLQKILFCVLITTAIETGHSNGDEFCENKTLGGLIVLGITHNAKSFHGFLRNLT